MLASHFSRFFAANPDLLHFAAHSHHPWPDVTQAAHARYWEDSATMADRKWAHVFGTVLPAAQDHVARLLSLSDARQVAFAPNTHEFVARLYSCLDWSRPVRVLASASEFHSFRRQTRRLAETGRLALTEIPAEPYATFDERFARAASSGPWDLVWLSHVFFDSGFVVRDLEGIVASAPASAVVAIDGYHAFHALPVDLSTIHRRAFYLAGGYKYAMAGKAPAFSRFPRDATQGLPIRAGSPPSTSFPENRGSRCPIPLTPFASGARRSIPLASIDSTRPWTGFPVSASPSPTSMRIPRACSSASWRGCSRLR
jgi:selenocysteine lyase/cysteine desulfurase